MSLNITVTDISGGKEELKVTIVEEPIRVTFGGETVTKIALGAKTAAEESRRLAALNEDESRAQADIAVAAADVAVNASGVATTKADEAGQQASFAMGFSDNAYVSAGDAQRSASSASYHSQLSINAADQAAIDAASIVNNMDTVDDALTAWAAYTTKEDIGVAASLDQAHVEATDPHPQYATEGEDASFNNLTVNGDLSIAGAVNEVASETLLVKDTFVVLNHGESGAGVTAGEAGIEVRRGTLPSFVVKFVESNDQLQAGIEGDIKRVAFFTDIPTTLPASDVSAWAKAATKPLYTAAEVGASPSTRSYCGKYRQTTSSVLSGHVAPWDSDAFNMIVSEIHISQSCYGGGSFLPIITRMVNGTILFFSGDTGESWVGLVTAAPTVYSAGVYKVLVTPLVALGDFNNVTNLDIVAANLSHPRAASDVSFAPSAPDVAVTVQDALLARMLASKGTLTSYGETVVTDAVVTGAKTIDCNLANVFNFTLTGNTTITITNPKAAGITTTLTLFLTQDGTGGRTVTWPGTVNWGNAGAPALSGLGKKDIITLSSLDGGTTWIGMYCGGGY